jgi:hypothetical protein
MTCSSRSTRVSPASLASLVIFFNISSRFATIFQLLGLFIVIRFSAITLLSMLLTPMSTLLKALVLIVPLGDRV